MDANETQGEERILWELEQSARCVLVTGPRGYELRIVRNDAAIVWRETGSEEAHLLQRSEEGRERLVARGWGARHSEVTSAPVSPVAASPPARVGTDTWGARIGATLLENRCPSCGRTGAQAVGEPTFSDLRRLYLCARCNYSWQGTCWHKIGFIVSFVTILGWALILNL
ncbi:MAG: hypothetical protein HYX76_08420 [Acidobacteria bacterium]|nr:hypothetical protein [Acidobacteriota bacterium]